MSVNRNVFKRAAQGAAGAAALGVGYASLVERNAFTLRETTMPVLAPGASSLRVLHISDLHMTPGQALDPLLARPGLFVFGSNDYFAPVPKNPLKYFKKDHKRVMGDPLPWRDLRAAFTERGWHDLTHVRHELEVAGIRIASGGVDDPHLKRDRYDTIAGAPNPIADLRLGLTHSPEPRVLDKFADDGYDLVLAGHTHGGQLCVPFYGALVTNCEIDRSRVKGPSKWGAHMQLHVSAGIGTSPWAPYRFCCRPEATLLTLVAAPPRKHNIGHEASSTEITARLERS